MNTKRLLLSDCEVKFLAAGAGSFTGYASVFNGVDSYNDTILPGAYKSVIDGISSGGRMPRMFVNHRHWEIPVGKWTHMSEDSKGLLMSGELTPGNPSASTLKAAMQHGTIDGLSIGYRLGPNDAETKDGVRVIKNISSLEEVSVVTFPADEAARVDLGSVKSALDQIESLKDFEDFLREAMGCSKGLATALASRVKRIVTQGEPAAELPKELRDLLARNQTLARSL